MAGLSAALAGAPTGALGGGTLSTVQAGPHGKGSCAGGEGPQLVHMQILTASPRTLQAPGIPPRNALVNIN